MRSKEHQYRAIMARAVRGGLVALAASLAAGAGCGDATSPVTAAAIVGTYALVSIGGHPLPAPYGGDATITSDVYTFDASGTCVDQSSIQPAGSSAPLVQSYSGTWTLDVAGARVVMLFHGSHDQAIYDTLAVRSGGRMLSFPGGGGEWLYQKQ